MKRSHCQLPESLLAAASRHGASAKATADVARAGHEVCREKLTPRRVKEQTYKRLLPARSVYQERTCAQEGGAVHTILVANVEHLLHFATQRCAQWRQMLQHAAAEARLQRPLKLVLFCDECQGGNILNPVPWKKMNMYYITFSDFPSRALLSPHAWLPFAAVPSLLIQNVDAGASRVMREMLPALAAHEREPIHLGSDHWATFKVHVLLSDMEGQRQVYASKGSAALRPCFLCSNVLKHDSGLAALQAGLVEVSCSERSKFQRIDSAAIFATCDEVAERPPSTRREHDRLEQTLGFTLNPESLLFDKQWRDKLPAEAILNDPLHCYFQGGVASWEAAMLVGRLHAELNVDLPDLARGAAAAKWQSAGYDKRSDQWRKNFFLRKRWSEEVYRGEVKELKALLPLLHYMAKLKVGTSGRLAEELQCMETLLLLLFPGCSLSCN